MWHRFLLLIVAFAASLIVPTIACAQIDTGNGAAPAFNRNSSDNLASLGIKSTPIVVKPKPYMLDAGEWLGTSSEMANTAGRVNTERHNRYVAECTQFWGTRPHKSESEGRLQVMRNCPKARAPDWQRMMLPVHLACERTGRGCMNGDLSIERQRLAAVMWQVQTKAVLTAIKSHKHPDEISGLVRDARQQAKNRFVRSACKMREFDSEVCRDVVSANMENSLRWHNGCEVDRSSEWIDKTGKTHPCAALTPKPTK